MELTDHKPLNIKGWAEEDRPREKLLIKGRAALSDAELLGILIGSGTPSMTAVDVAKFMLQQMDNDLNQLARCSVNDLKKFKGIGEAKAITIVSALELGRRRKLTTQAKRPKIGSAQEAHEFMKPYLLDLGHEEFWALLLNNQNLLIKKQLISTGGLNATLADPRIIFRHGLEAQATSLVLMHNHPSGNLNPSNSDKKLTEKLQAAGKLVDIPVIDHIIFTNDGYYSFADEGLL